MVNREPDIAAAPPGLDLVPGCRYWPGLLGRADQERLVEAVRAVVRAAPLTVPTMPRTGRPFSVHMTNAGPLGWVSDRDGGYRYQPSHPETGRPWPPIPAEILAVWRRLLPDAPDPECCLVNLYRAGARMGQHRDADEPATEVPVLSISLGDTALFRFGGPRRGDPTRSVRLASGDVVVFGGPARLAYHGIDRVLAGTSTLLDGGGRINLTLRRVTP